MVTITQFFLPCSFYNNTMAYYKLTNVYKYSILKCTDYSHTNIPTHVLSLTFLHMNRIIISDNRFP